MRFMVVLAAVALLNVGVDTRVFAGSEAAQINLSNDTELPNTRAKVATTQISTKKKVAITVAAVAAIGVLAAMYWRGSTPARQSLSSGWELLTTVGIEDPDQKGKRLSSIKEILDANLIPAKGEPFRPEVAAWVKQVEALKDVDFLQFPNLHQMSVMALCRPLISLMIDRELSDETVEKQLITISAEVYNAYFRALSTQQKLGPRNSSGVASPYELFIFHKNLRTNLNIYRALKRQPILFLEEVLDPDFDFEEQRKSLPKYPDGTTIETLSGLFQQKQLKFNRLQQLVDILELRAPWISKDFLDMVTQSSKAQYALNLYKFQLGGFIIGAARSLADKPLSLMDIYNQLKVERYESAFPVVSPHFHQKVMRLVEEFVPQHNDYPYSFFYDSQLSRLGSNYLAQYALGCKHIGGVPSESILDHSFLWVNNILPKEMQKKEEEEINSNEELQAGASRYLRAVRKQYIEERDVPEDQLKDEDTIYKELTLVGNKEEIDSFL